MSKNAFPPNADTHNVTTRRVWAYITAHVAEHGYAPSIRDVAQHCGMSSVSTAYVHINKLDLAGYIAMGPERTSRSMKLLIPFVEEPRPKHTRIGG